MAEESILLSGLSGLKDIGFFEFFLPFMLFFAIIYGALQKTKIFGDASDVTVRTVNSVVALVIALIASTTAWVIGGLKGFLPWVGFIAVAVVSFLIILVLMAGGDLEKFVQDQDFMRYAKYAVIIMMVGVLAYVLGAFDLLKEWNISNTDIALVLLVAVGILLTLRVIKGGGGAPVSSSN